MTQRINFTIKSLEGLESREKLYEVHDEKLRGLIVQVRPTGTKTFYLYRKVMGKPERIKIGNINDISVENARKAAQALNGEIVKGKNPQDIKRAERSETTFGEFFKLYMEKHSSVHKRATSYDAEQYQRHIKASFGNKRLSTIRRVDVQTFHNDLKNKVGAATANRVLNIVSSVFTKALAWDYLSGDHPARGITKFPTVSRSRFLKPDEMPRFFESLEMEANESVKDYIKLSLFTGARKTNVLEMRWQDIDLAHATWTIPMTKNGDALTVPLVKQALEILQKRKADSKDSPYVFPSNAPKGHLQDPKKGWQRLLKRAGLSDLHLHDLRRTIGSYQAIQGVSLLQIARSLGQKSPEAAQVYARLTVDPIRQAMQNAVTGMVTPLNQDENNG